MDTNITKEETILWRAKEALRKDVLSDCIVDMLVCQGLQRLRHMEHWQSPTTQPEVRLSGMAKPFSGAYADVDHVCRR